MATPDELRAALDQGRTAMREAIEAAEMAWRATAGGDAWSAQQTTEHVIEVEALFTTAMCDACGYPGVDVVRPDCASSTEALDEFDAVVNNCNAKLKNLTQEDLAKVHERFGTVEEIMAMNLKHLTEHSAQIREAAGA